MQGDFPFSPLNLHALCIILVLLARCPGLLTGALSVRNTRISDCKIADCGDGVEIRYPLWISNGSDETICGYPCLGVVCEKESPVLTLGQQKYRISGVRYDESTITLQGPRLREDFEPSTPHFASTGDPAPPPSVEKKFFQLLMQCPDSSPFLSIACLTTSGKMLYGRTWKNDSANSCQGKGITDGQIKARWRNEYCRYCQRAKGFCLYSKLSPSYCKRSGDGTMNWQFKASRSDEYCDRCKKENGTCVYKKLSRPYCKRSEKRKWKKILIGVGAGAGGVVLASLFCLFFYRRQQVERQAVNSKLLSLTASSDRSSRKDLEDGGDTTGAPFFRYEELHEATSGFCPSNELGDGGFGTVYKGKLRDGRVVAVKRLYENNFKRVEQFLNEAAILNRLRHPNLVSLYGCTSRHSRELLLVYEYIPNGTVADHLHGDLAPQRALPWSVRLRIAAETASALAYLHSTAPPIIHRDVKTNNILLDSGFHVKVADFGLSRLFPLDVTHISTAPQGTPGYVDPEYHQCYQLTDKSDVYSFGVVLVELISSKPAVDITRRRNEINLSSMAISMIQRGKLGEFVDQDLGFEADPEVRRTVKVVAELAFRCLQTEKEMRPTMEDALEVLRATMGGKEGETEVVQPVKKIEEVSLLKAIMPPRSPNSVMHNWSSQTTTPNASG